MRLLVLPAGIFAVVLLLAPAAIAQELDFRTWTDVRGRTAKMAFRGFSEKKVRMQSAEGKEFLLPLSQLSVPDRDYVVQAELKRAKAISGGDRAALISELRQLAGEIDAKHAPLFLEIGHTAVQNKEWDTASQAFEAFSILAPKSPEGPMALARLHEQRGDLREAESWYQKALVLSPQDMQIREAIDRLKGRAAPAAEGSKTIESYGSTAVPPTMSPPVSVPVPSAAAGAPNVPPGGVRGAKPGQVAVYIAAGVLVFLVGLWSLDYLRSSWFTGERTLKRLSSAPAKYIGGQRYFTMQETVAACRRIGAEAGLVTGTALAATVMLAAWAAARLEIPNYANLTLDAVAGLALLGHSIYRLGRLASEAKSAGDYQGAAMITGARRAALVVEVIAFVAAAIAANVWLWTRAGTG